MKIHRRPGDGEGAGRDGSPATPGSTSSCAARRRRASASASSGSRRAPGTRWHSHAVGQTVHVTEGVGRIQARGGEVLEIRAGDTIYTPPGEWHWHGAAPDRFMTHLAIFEAPADGPETEWAPR